MHISPINTRMKKMYPIDKNLPFYTSLLVLWVLRYYPNENKIYNEKFFIRFLYCWIIFWGGNTANIGILFLTNLIGGNYNEVPTALAFFVSHAGAVFCCLFFALRHKDWSDLFQSLVSYGKFGKPPKYDKVKKRGDTIAGWFITYPLGGLVYTTAMVLLNEDRCEKIYHGQRICGVLNPAWWPPEIELSLLSKRLLLIYQLLSDVSTAGFHITTLLTCEEICLINDAEEQFQKFKMWVDYHNDIIRICAKLNNVSRRTVGHVTIIVTIILACLAHQSIKEHTLKYILHMIIYLGAVFLICHAGERMESQMLKIGDSVYSSQWYQCNKKIKQLIPFIILRSQRRSGLDALPIGKANYLLLLMVLKTTYSYVTLLNQTM